MVGENRLIINTSLSIVPIGGEKSARASPRIPYSITFLVDDRSIEMRDGFLNVITSAYYNRPRGSQARASVRLFHCRLAFLVEGE